MIIDLQRFIIEERNYWSELEDILDRMENEPANRMSMDEAKHFHYLYQRTSADLAKLKTFSSEKDISQYLELLIARAYSEIHETRKNSHRFAPVQWFFRTFPRAFRRHIAAFLLSLAITLGGGAFGGIALTFDQEAKEVIMPFSHLSGDPSDRVADEETSTEDRLAGAKMSGSAWYMTHNTKVSIFTIVLGLTWGAGTVLMLFYNGVILGAVAVDYILAGESTFLIAWLSPHGVIEIPAILLAGQAGLVLAGAMIGWGNPMTLSMRLRKISGDLVTLSFGVAIMLVWAGFIESFISQYHEPVLPYSLKTGFGIVELVLLILFLARSGMKSDRKTEILYER